MSYTTNTTHRLQTISLTQALSQQSTPSARISTGSHALDALLSGGLLRGQVAELVGPPGAGKTRFLAHIATSAAQTVWISCTSPPHLPPALHETVTHIHTPTLAHLLALLLHNVALALPPCELLVIDDISAPFTAAFPPGEAATRRSPLVLALVQELGRIAATRNAVVAVGTQMGTRVVGGVGAVLQSALALPQWTGGVAVRLAVLGREGGGREVRVVKMDGREAEEGVARCWGVWERGVWKDVEMEEDQWGEEVSRELENSQRLKELRGTPQPNPLTPLVMSQSPSQTEPGSMPPPPTPSRSTLQAPVSPPRLPQKRKRSETTGIAAGVIPDSDDDDDDSSDGEEVEDAFGYGDDGIFEIGEKKGGGADEAVEVGVEGFGSACAGETAGSGDTNIISS